MGDFVHLHLHSEFSLLDGAAGIKKTMGRAAEFGMTSVAITDHGVMYGAIDFYTEAKKMGIKPIIGCEVYTAPGSRFDKMTEGYKPYGHLVLLCKNETGYKNLMKLVTLSNTEGFYYKPRVDRELLLKYNEGLIALSGCLRGDVAMAYLNRGYGAAKDMAQEFIRIFGRENFYLEIQRHGLLEEDKLREGLKRLSEDLGLGLVATNDVHYVDKADALIQDVLSCIQTGKKLSDTDRMRMEGDQYYFKSCEEMSELFSDCPEAIENTVKIAGMCNLTIDMDTMHLPRFISGVDIPNKDYLEALSLMGLKKRYPIDFDKHKKRLEYELTTINNMGFTDYFLIVHDLIYHAKSEGIPIGPGRGSAAGSLVSYCLDITEIDPIEKGLIFERFLNPERISMPDIDIDICYERRNELRDYAVEKYGSDSVSQIITFGTMAAKAAIKDVARVMGIELSYANKVSKAVPKVLHISLKEALEQSEDLREMYVNDAEIKRLIDTAMAIEGFPRHSSVHAAGVVIGGGALSDFVPLQLSDEGLITQYPMSALESIGLLKMDFLGLRNLTIIKDAEKLINETHLANLDIEKIPLDDELTFNMIQRGDTDALFQLENPGLQNFLRKFRPKSIDDIILTTSIYRPGPMEQIPLFLENVKSPDKIRYKHPKLEPILKSTYGVVIYQEQVMDIVRSLAGYSLGRADLVRRAMSKKKTEVMAREREVFLHGLTQDNNIVVEGAVRRGVDETKANEIFDSLIDFAKYAFNKSHAACYALVAYRTAYLKAHYPTEYLASVLKNYQGYTSKANKYLASFKKYGIKLLVPDVNKSYTDFGVEGKNVRFGFGWIKGVGVSFPEAIVREREENGEFSSFTDFIKRMSLYDITKRAVDAMVRCGCFDSIYPNRQVLIFNTDRLIDEHLTEQRAVGRGQLSFLSLENEGRAPRDVGFLSEGYVDFTKVEKLAMEKEYTSFYFSGHPMDLYAFKAEAFGETTIAELCENSPPDGRASTVCGIIEDFSVRRTKQGRYIASMTLSDFTSSIKLIAFEKAYLKYKSFLVDGSAIAASVTVSVDDEDKCELLLNGAATLDSLEPGYDKKLYLKVKDKQRFEDMKDFFAKYQGRNPLLVYIESDSQLYRSDMEHGIRLDGEVFDKLCSLLGAENVKIK